MTAANPELFDVIDIAITSALGAMRVIGIGQVASYNPKAQSAVVKSVVKFAYWDDDEEVVKHYDPMPLPNIPVLHMSAGGFFSAMPVKAGDQGVILTADRSIDGWKNNGGTGHEGRDGRRFDFADSLFLPVGVSFANALEHVDKANEKWIWGEETPTGFRFELGKGKFEFGTTTVKFMKQFVDALGANQKVAQNTATSVVVTLLGPQPLSNAATIAAQALTLTAIKAIINTIRGT